MEISQRWLREKLREDAVVHPIRKKKEQETLRDQWWGFKRIILNE